MLFPMKYVCSLENLQKTKDFLSRSFENMYLCVCVGNEKIVACARVGMVTPGTIWTPEASGIQI